MTTRNDLHLVSSGEVPTTAVLTFLIADIRGYTRFTEERGDEAAGRLATRFAAIASEVVKDRGGEVIELRGDEALSVFHSTRNAIRAALELQDRFAQETAEVPSMPLRVGIGIDAGEAIPVHGGYRGGALNLAARLCSLAAPGEALISETVVHLAGSVEDFTWVDRGQVELKGLSIPVRVYQLLWKGAPSPSTPAFILQAAPSNNLPDQPTPFIGREREVAQILELLRSSQVRLLTLTGPGGAGKTRLALQATSQAVGEFPNGAFFVSLAPVEDSRLVIATIARNLGIKETAGESVLETLVEARRTSRLLLVLDNFEHVLPAAPIVASMLAGIPGLKVLVTSRAALHLSVERDYPVPPLMMPDPAHLPNLISLSQYDAVALFISRAKAVKHDFAISNDSAPAVAEICFRLGGLPLAIELAAARSKLFPPRTLLSRLHHPLSLLTGGPRDLPARQQTIRAAIEWSYNLLTSTERPLFRRIGVFAGGCTFEAAEAVCGPEGEIDVLDGIDALVDSSLLMCASDRTGEGRFTMLETIREYALERLDAAGETEQVKRAHAKYFVEAVESLGADLWGGPQQITSSYRLELEQDNIRAALQWTLDAGEGELALRLATAMRRFWIMRAYMTEGRRWLQAVLDLEVPDHLALRSQAIHAAGWLAANQHDFKGAVALFEQGLGIARTVDDRHTVAEMVVGIGHASRMQGDFTRAIAMFKQGADLGRQVGDKRAVALSVGNHGMIAHALGELDQAEALLEEARDLHQQLGDQEDVAWSLAFLGRVARARGDNDRARDRLVQSLLLFMDLTDRNGAVFVVEGLAGLAATQRDGLRAAKLFGAAEALRDAINLPMVPFDRPEYERDVEAGRSTLELNTWREAWCAGRAIHWDEAVQVALSCIT